MDENVLAQMEDTAPPSSEFSVFQEQAQLGSTLPEATLKNRSALTAITADDPENITTNYQRMVVEGGAGSDETNKALSTRATQASYERDIKAATSIMADPAVSIEEKAKVLDSFRTYKANASTILTTNSLSRHSAGESKDAEVARLSVADMIKEVQDVSDAKQALVNAYTSRQYWKGKPEMKHLVGSADFAIGAMLPFTTNIQAAKLAAKELEGRDSFFGFLKSAIAPGEAYNDMAQKFKNTPVPQQLAMAEQMLQSIDNTAGLILNENQIDKLTAARNIIAGDYTGIDRLFDNLIGLADAFGVGMLARGYTKGSKAVKGATETTKVAGTVGEATVPSAEFIDTIRPRTTKELKEVTAGFNDRLVDKLETEKAQLIATAGNAADKGRIASINQEIATLLAQRVSSDKASLKASAKELQQTQGLSYKDALAKATKDMEAANASTDASIYRLQSQVEVNRQASQASQRIAAIDTEIKQLKANRPDVPGGLTPIADLVRRIEMQSVTHVHNPSSPAAIIQQANPEQARGLFHVVMTDTEDMATALYGNPKLAAIAGDVFPQVTTSAGRVVTKPVDLQRSYRNSADFPPEIASLLRTTGALDLSDVERASAEANLTNRFKHATGLSINEPMSSFAFDGTNYRFSAVYGTEEGSFSNAKQAYDQALYALSRSGVKPEEVTILRKDGIDHVPVDLEQVKDIPGNYLVRVDIDAKFDPTDVTSWSNLTAKRNWLNRYSNTTSTDTGSWTRTIFDPASVLDPITTGAASTAFDRSSNLKKILLGYVNEYTDRFKKLDSAQQLRVDNYIREANEKQLKFDVARLHADNWSQAEIDTVHAFRQFWDIDHKLENMDAVRSFRQQGYEKLVTENADLLVKPYRSAVGVEEVYDPTQDLVVKIAPQARQELLDAGGYFGKLQRPAEFDGKSVEFVIVRNNTEEYTRKLRDDDVVLNRLDGYYQVRYKAPIFVDETTKSGTRAVAVAGNQLDAERFMERMRVDNPDAVYVARGDTRAVRTGSNDWYDLNAARGRMSQRHRGKLLESSDGLNILGDGSFVVSPVDAAIHAARSVAGRTVTRPMLDAAKERFVQTRGDVLNDSVFGTAQFPMSLAEIGKKGEPTSAAVATAKAEFEYIRYLENGYINGLDNFSKGIFNDTAKFLGELSVKVDNKYKSPKLTSAIQSVESAARNVGEIGPTGVLKGAVNLAWISGHPLRQFVLQPVQAMRTIAYNPIGWSTGNIPRLAFESVTHKLNQGLTPLTKEGKQFFDFVDESGMLAGIDESNLVRGTLLSMADSSNRVQHAVKSFGTAVRSIGYDPGETINTLFHAAAVWDKAVREGKDITKAEVRAMIHSEANAVKGDFNFAGDFAYTQQAVPGIIGQFLQVPHKMILQPFNRRIDQAARARMFLFDTVVWGVPGYAIASRMLGGDILPDDPEMREKVTDGLFSFYMNKAMQTVFDNPDMHTDLAALAPNGMDGFWRLFDTIMSEGAYKAIINSPSGVLLKDGNSIQRAIHGVMQLVGISSDDYDSPQEAEDVLWNVARVFKGADDATRAYIAYEAGQYYNKKGQLVDGSFTMPEAFLLALGFAPSEERKLFDSIKEMQKVNKDLKDEVNKNVDLAFMYYQDQLNSGNTDTAFMAKVNAFVMRKYEHNPQALMYATERQQFWWRDPKSGFAAQIMKSQGLHSEASFKDFIKTSPLDEETKKIILDRQNDVDTINMKGK